jgi:hypothetical protein
MHETADLVLVNGKITTLDRVFAKLRGGRSSATSSARPG